MYRTDNPDKDFLDYDAEQSEYERKLPHCDYCGEAIHEKYYEIDGETICEECLEANFAKWVND